MIPAPEAGPARSAAVSGGAPLADGELHHLFAPVAEAAVIALAVSGGADSLALLDAARRWRAGRLSGPALTVLTVDHGLRQASAREAAAVAVLATRQGLACEVLRWNGPRPASGVEAAAREARYRLLADAARRVGAAFLLTAHHQDDQAETLLLRLAAGSGVGGLAAMRRFRVLETDGMLPAGIGRDRGSELVLYRPFLGLPKARLLATAAAAGLSPAVDETNHDLRFARPRLRRLMRPMAEEGLGAPALARAAARIGRASAALDHYAARLVGEAVTVDPVAVARLNPARYAEEPEEVRLRALGRLLAAIGGRPLPPRTAQLEALDAALMAGERFRRTLAGVVVAAARAAGITLFRESGRHPPDPLLVTAGFDAVWDHRFRIVVEDAPAADIHVAPLGEQGRLAAGAVGTRHPAAALITLPAFRSGRRLLAVPSLGLAPPRGCGLRLRVECLIAARLAPPVAAGEATLV